MRKTFFLAVLGLAAVCACGGNVSVEQSGAASGAASGTGGAPPGGASSSTATSGTGGAPDGCPVNTPQSGAACSMPGLVCPIAYSCCGQAATCNQGHWEMAAPACAMACIPCGPSLGCSLDAVCVTEQVDAAQLHRCAANPCAGTDLDCSCAFKVCTIDVPAACTSAKDFQVTCETFTN